MVFEGSMLWTAFDALNAIVPGGCHSGDDSCAPTCSEARLARISKETVLRIRIDDLRCHETGEPDGFFST